MPVCLEPLAQPGHAPSFLLDWELTMKCNLDCSYCGTGLYGGHDNTTAHPPLQDCLNTIDFMYAYADAYLAYKTRGLQKVVLNVYGGEALHHPHIVSILEAAKQKHQDYAWPITITTTTNAIISEKKLQSLLPLIDQFTVSYHPESADKHKQQFRNNLLVIKNSGRAIKCVVLMHPQYFEDAQQQVQWCQEHEIACQPKAIDHPKEWPQFNYDPKQVIWLNQLYNTDISPAASTDVSEQGRACCGSRQLFHDENYKQSVSFVYNKFPDWYCSVNWFFVYVKQVNGEVFVNKDCMMNFDGSVGPIGNLSESTQLLDKLKTQLQNNSLPVIQCKKHSCWCGLCAPKAQTMEKYTSIMQKYQRRIS
jgi:pyruvate-formate lyase-activating enzyme